MIVQIYGITTPDDAQFVDGCGADHVGLALDEGFDNWDRIDARTLRLVRRELTHVRVVALSLAVDLDRILATVEAVEPSILHLARLCSPDHLPVLEALRPRLGSIELMVTVPVTGAGAVTAARALDGLVDYLLLDSADPVTGAVGATGRTHDWAVSARVVAAVRTPVVLAGGLGPENVVDAIRQVRPAGVDSETRTSMPADRRRKDPERVRQFVRRARELG